MRGGGGPHVLTLGSVYQHGHDPSLGICDWLLAGLQVLVVVPVHRESDSQSQLYVDVPVPVALGPRHEQMLQLYLPPLSLGSL